MWYVYLLWNTVTKKTYIGCTVDPVRRLKQHNGQLRGGARSTAKGKPYWILDTVLQGFQNRSEAMRWEKILKSRRRGLEARRAGFVDVAGHRCPMPGREYEVPITVEILNVVL